MEPDDLGTKKQHKPSFFAITSFILAIAPIIILLLIFVILVLVSGGSFLGDVGGALWPLFLILLVGTLVIGLIANILAVIFGIIAIVKRKTFFSWVGIIIVAVEFLILVLL